MSSPSPVVDLLSQILEKSPYAVLCIMVVGLWKISRLVERVQSQNGPSRAEFLQLVEDNEKLRADIDFLKQTTPVMTSRIDTLWHAAGMSSPERNAERSGGYQAYDPRTESDPFRRRRGEMPAVTSGPRPTPFRRPRTIPREDPPLSFSPTIPEEDDEDED